MLANISAAFEWYVPRHGYAKHQLLSLLSIVDNTRRHQLWCLIGAHCNWTQCSFFLHQCTNSRTNEMSALYMKPSLAVHVRRRFWLKPNMRQVARTHQPSRRCVLLHATWTKCSAHTIGGLNTAANVVVSESHSAVLRRPVDQSSPAVAPIDWADGALLEVQEDLNGIWTIRRRTGLRQCTAVKDVRGRAFTGAMAKKKGAAKNRKQKPAPMLEMPAFVPDVKDLPPMPPADVDQILSPLSDGLAEVEDFGLTTTWVRPPLKEARCHTWITRSIEESTEQWFGALFCAMYIVGLNLDRKGRGSYRW